MISFESIIFNLQTWPPELLLVIEYALCCITLLIMLRLFSVEGIYVYMALAVIIANMQVLKIVNFNIVKFPVALGTIVFSSTFLAVDILTEFYGTKVAKRAIWLSFSACLIITLFMNLTLAFVPLSGNELSANDITAHQAISKLFSPAPAILSASLISYLCSQYTDIWIYQTIRRLTAQKWLALRTITAAMVSAFIDNVLFSFLAWIIFAPQPISFDQLFYTYILGTYIFRLIIIVLQTPVMYGVRLMTK